jgi:hypothetical protein
MKVKIIRDNNFEKIADNVKPDANRRIHLPEYSEGISYNVYQNSVGQIVLDPQVSIPASEAWLFMNKVALTSVKQGHADAAAGRTSIVDINHL